MKKSFLFKKIPVYFLLITALGVSAVTYFIAGNTGAADDTEISQAVSTDPACSNKPVRMTGYNFVKPLLFTDNPCEANNYYSLKSSIELKFAQFKQQGVIETAALYFRDFQTTEWMSINPDEKFSPGSLLKVPELITFLKMEERKPGILKEVCKVNTLPGAVPDKNPVFLSKSIQAGKSYTTDELLRYMISYSDNNATILLNNRMDAGIFEKVFTDIGLAAPDIHAADYPVSVLDYSKFFRVLFNASYISAGHSEYAAEILSTCDFKQGFVGGLPAGTKIIHKFGESGSPDMHDLSESAIIYVNDKPYLLTVMVKGKDLLKLPVVLSECAKSVYADVSGSVASITQ